MLGHKIRKWKAAQSAAFHFLGFCLNTSGDSYKTEKAVARSPQLFRFYIFVD